MKDPEQYLEFLHRQLEMISETKSRKEEEIREHINRYNLNKGQSNDRRING